MASENQIAYATAVLLLDLYRKRALSPVEVTRLLLDRLDGLFDVIVLAARVEH